ncbi:hypothetical protein Leryth_006584 [Lithospermum erythrorhizon]|nr:hypothetical protein Leryth_006584 [Lithospermum erythrorhizon]
MAGIGSSSVGKARFVLISQRGNRSFGRLNHREGGSGQFIGVVPHCGNGNLDGSEKLLVYEYMGGGSLEDLITNKVAFSWRQRIDTFSPCNLCIWGVPTLQFCTEMSRPPMCST